MLNKFIKICIKNRSSDGYGWEHKLTIGEKYEIFEEHKYNNKIYYRVVDNDLSLGVGGFPASWFITEEEYIKQQKARNMDMSTDELEKLLTLYNSNEVVFKQ